MRKPKSSIETRSTATDDIILELNGSKVFSKVDFNIGFHQLELSEESHNMRVFASHVGLYRKKRLNFGVSIAPEKFQNEVRQVLPDLEGTLNFSDDITIHAPDREEHDRRLEAVLQRLQDKNFTLNKQKCEFGKTSVQFYLLCFFGQRRKSRLSQNHSNSKYSRAEECRCMSSFLGMTNYLSKIIDKYSTFTAPLRELLNDNSEFKWTHQHQSAFDQLKQGLCNDTVMSYFDPKKFSEL